MEVNNQIELDQSPVQTPVTDRGNDLAKEWSTPTAEKTAGAAANDTSGGNAGANASAQFDPNIPVEKEPLTTNEPVSPEEDMSLDMMTDSAIAGIDFLLTTGSTLALQTTLLNRRDRETLFELLADGVKDKKVRTDYEDWILNAAGQIEKHKQEAPLTEREKQAIKPPLKPLIRKVWEAMQQKASPGWALAVALGPIALARMAPVGGAAANQFFFNNKPAYARATDVTHEG